MIYVAGKIRGLENYNLVFNAAKKYLNKHGLKHTTAVDFLNSINYTQLKENQIISHINDFIYNSNDVYVIPNYIYSDGTKLELRLAEYYKKNIVYLNWTDLFDNDFKNDFQNYFNIDFNSRVEGIIDYKHILVYLLNKYIISFTSIGKILYTTKSNAHGTVHNAIENVKYTIDGLQGLQKKKDFLHKKELIEKWIEEYYAN